MVRNSVKTIAASLVVVGTLGVPAIGSAQGYRYGDHDRSDRTSVAVRCAPGQRAVMEQRRTHRGSRVVARCVGSRRVAHNRYNRYNRYDRTSYGRGAGYDTYRPASRRCAVLLRARAPALEDEDRTDDRRIDRGRRRSRRRAQGQRRRAHRRRDRRRIGKHLRSRKAPLAHPREWPPAAAENRTAAAFLLSAASSFGGYTAFGSLAL